MEARRLDKLEQVIRASGQGVKTLRYALRVCQQLVINRTFRQQVRSCSCFISTPVPVHTLRQESTYRGCVTICA